MAGSMNNVITNPPAVVKGHPITIGQILGEFVASCNGKIK
jgi:hypothetical protein